MFQIAQHSRACADWLNGAGPAATLTLADGFFIRVARQDGHLSLFHTYVSGGSCSPLSPTGHVSSFLCPSLGTLHAGYGYVSGTLISVFTECTGHLVLTAVRVGRFGFSEVY
jgi:hypothetical protein